MIRSFVTIILVLAATVTETRTKIVDSTAPNYPKASA